MISAAEGSQNRCSKPVYFYYKEIRARADSEQEAYILVDETQNPGANA